MAAKGVGATLVGLKSRPELNGLRACVLAEAQPNGRVPICVRAPDGVLQQILVKMESLTIEPSQLLLADLPHDALGLVLCRLQLAIDIARAAQVSRQLKLGAEVAFVTRPRTGTVLTIGHAEDHGLCAAADDGHIITLADGGDIGVWRGGELVRTLEVDAGWVAVLPGGRRFISCSGNDDGDGTAKLFTFGGELERTFDVHQSVREAYGYGSDDDSGAEVGISCVAALPDGVHFAIGLGDDIGIGDVRLYTYDGRLVHAFQRHSTWGTHPESMAVTSDGKHIIVGTADHLVQVWNVERKCLRGSCGAKLNRDASAGHTSIVEAVAAMPDNQRILSGSRDKSVRVWRLDGTLENTFSLHTDSVYALVALPDNQHALSGSGDKTVKLFGVNNGAILRMFAHHTECVNSLALSSDGLSFVSCSDDTGHSFMVVAL